VGREDVRLLGSLAADSARQLDVLGHDGHSLGVDGAEVGILKETDEISFGGLLQGRDGGALESQFGLELLRNLADESLEGQLSDEKLGRLLEAADLAEGDGSGAESMGFLDAAALDGRFARRFVADRLAGRFSSCGFTGSLLGSCHG